MNADKNEKINVVKEFQRLMGDRNLDAAFQLIDKDAVWHSDEIGAPWSGIHHGIEQVKSHFQNISGTTKNFKRTIKDLIEHKDKVIELGELSCILNKTEQPFATEYVCIYTVNDKKITSYRIFEDSLKLYKAYFHCKNEEKLGIKFKQSVTAIADGEMAKVVKSSNIDKHFPASAPGAINIFNDVSMSVGMVQTEHYPSYPHSNDYDEVHYVIRGTAKFRHGNSDIFEIEAGDIVYVKSPEQHEWFDCSSDFKLFFVQSKKSG